MLWNYIFLLVTLAFGNLNQEYVAFVKQAVPAEISVATHG